MRVYTIQESDYSDLEENLECVIEKAKKFLKKMEHSSEYGSRNYGSRNRDYEEDDDYDWKIKKGSRY